ncbi:MAG TPA: DUF2892 domain-containing protein [Pirellulales bacterium]|nr:DUF2892 domain-containing protein [Pirellulales bacterium]
MNTFSQACGHGGREVNVGEAERAVSLVVGGALAVRAIQRMDVVTLALAALGAGLIFRGATGHCGLYQLLGTQSVCHRSGAKPETVRQQTGDPLRSFRADEDIVAEASLESFPASDAPAWTSATAMPMPARMPHVSS